MYQFSNLNNNQILSNLFISALPISFIAGNMIININILLIILSTLFLYRKDFFTIKLYYLDKFLITFFFLILITGIYNDISININNKIFSEYRGIFYTTFKSVLFLKYLFLYFSIRYLVEKNILNFKLFYSICAISSLFVCFDLLIQFIFGKDIFGFPANPSRKLGGPFGDELIAGGYIQRFSLFAFFVLPFFFNIRSKKILFFVVPFLFVVFSLGIILSGNRMPMILFLFLMCLIILFQKNTRKYFLLFVFIFSVISFLAFNFNEKIKNNYSNLYMQISTMTLSLINKNLDDKTAPQYIKEFSSFYNTWLINKYVGGGIKNFRYYCHIRPNIKKDSKFICNMHPHNYYLEILTESGLVGFLILIISFSIILKKTLYDKYLSRLNLQNNNTIIPFIFLFIVEIFPIKSTGSFFTTGNTTYLFLIIGILIALVRRDNIIVNDK